MVKVNTTKTIKTIAQALRRAFTMADCPDDIEPIFREAAEGGEDEGGGAKWHAWGIRGLPGAKYHTMTGQSETSADVRRSRKYGRLNRGKVLNRPDYYSSFDAR